MIEHIRAVWRYRYFWMSLVKMDVRSRYRRSVLGIGWSLLHPLAMSAVFCIVFSGIMNIGEDPHWTSLGFPEAWRGYSAFLILGITIWDFFRASIGGGCLALIGNEAYIRQCPLPFGIYSLRTVMGTAVHFCFGMIASIGLLIFLKQSLEPLAILWSILPTMILYFFFCWGVATIAAFATVFFHDTTHIVDVGAQLVFFMTPILYTADRLKQYESFLILHPVYPFIVLIRDPLITNTPPDPNLFLHAAAITAGTVALAFGVIAWLQKKVIFEL